MEPRVKKDEAEKALRYLCHKWREETGRSNTPESELCFSDYLSWVRENSNSYLTFRSVMPVTDVVETWFNQEFHQTWRN